MKNAAVDDDVPHPDHLETEYLQDAVRRLGLLALLVAAGMVFAVLAWVVRVQVMGWESATPTERKPAVTAAFMMFWWVSLGMFAMTRTAWHPRRLLNLGLAYQLLGAVLLSAIYVDDRFLQEFPTRLGFLGVWIVLFPLFVPAFPIKNLLVSVVAATIAPATYFLFLAIDGRPMASPQVLVSTFSTYYLCAGIAFIPAIHLYRLGRTVSVAGREMRKLPNLLRTERLAVAGSLAAGVAHEVNNPLAAISSIVQTVRGSSEDTQSRELLGEALEQMDRIGRALQELMHFARPPARVNRTCNLNEVVQRTLHFLLHDKRFRRLSIDTKLDPALKTIQADPDQLQQVVTNLLINARDALEDTTDPRVVVTTRATEDGVELSVRDNGPGISAEVRERLFEPFFTTKPPGKGTGLGLAVCRELVREYEGTLELNGVEGGGTAARLSLPS